MAYKLSEINRRASEDPVAFVAEFDAKYSANVVRAADKIISNLDKSKIVLLSGPSGSGKTTTAKNIEIALEKRGITTHTISLDNYFRDVDPLTSPRGPDGEYDFESPDCLDTDLLIKHFYDLDHGTEIMVPKFEFHHQKRNDARAVPLRIVGDEVVIFEGIHALNDILTEQGEGVLATKVYISARSNIEHNGKVVFKGTWMRIVRRAIRDRQFRDTPPSRTFRMWESVRVGEKKYISPFKNKADIIFDSSFMYEVPVLKNRAASLFEDIDPATQRFAEIMDMKKSFELFETIDEALVPPESLLREFLGGGNIKY